MVLKLYECFKQQYDYIQDWYNHAYGSITNSITLDTESKTYMSMHSTLILNESKGRPHILETTTDVHRQNSPFIFYIVHVPGFRQHPPCFTNTPWKCLS